MIRTPEQFQAALEEGTRLLNASPPEGTPDHQRLLTLMQDIAAYRPAVRWAPADENPAAERLSRQLGAFEKRLVPPLASHWRSMIGGDVGARR
jgi:antitoxin component HigA of HigAB toxin-antitoxin module